MNFLIHCWLGRENQGLIAGGFLGDFIKGPDLDSYPIALRQGIRLHRYIDFESNRMQSMRSTYFRFGDRLRRPAPILLDLVADHVFAKRWSDYANGDIQQFTQRCYHSISQYELPFKAQNMYDYMLRTDLFARYAEIDVIYDICRRILKRLNLSHLAGELACVLHAKKDDFEKDFEVYFPLLEVKANEWLHCQG